MDRLDAAPRPTSAVALTPRHTDFHTPLLGEGCVAFGLRRARCVRERPFSGENGRQLASKGLQSGEWGRMVARKGVKGSTFRPWGRRK